MKEMLIMALIFSVAGILFLITSARKNDNAAAVGAAAAVLLSLIGALIMIVYL